MELSYDAKQNFSDRISFICQYAKWVKRVPNKIWSRQHADFINNMMKNSKNCNLNSEQYLKIKSISKKKI